MLRTPIVIASGIISPMISGLKKTAPIDSQSASRRAATMATTISPYRPPRIRDAFCRLVSAIEKGRPYRAALLRTTGAMPS